MTELEKGVELTSFDGDSPVEAVGRVDGRYFRFLWWENTWVFAVAHHESNLYVDRDFCLWNKKSPYLSLRPLRKSKELVGEVKKIIHSCVEEWRAILTKKR